MVALLIEKVTDLNFMLALLGGLAVAATVAASKIDAYFRMV